MITHRFADVHSCGLLKAVQNCVININYLGPMLCFCTKINSSDSLNTLCNASLQIALVSFWAY